MTAKTSILAISQQRYDSLHQKFTTNRSSMSKSDYRLYYFESVLRSSSPTSNARDTIGRFCNYTWTLLTYGQSPAIAKRATMLHALMCDFTRQVISNPTETLSVDTTLLAPIFPTPRMGKVLAMTQSLSTHSDKIRLFGDLIKASPLSTRKWRLTDFSPHLFPDDELTWLIPRLVFVKGTPFFSILDREKNGPNLLHLCARAGTHINTIRTIFDIATEDKEILDELKEADKCMRSSLVLTIENNHPVEQLEVIYRSYTGLDGGSFDINLNKQDCYAQALYVAACQKQRWDYVRVLMNLQNNAWLNAPTIPRIIPLTLKEPLKNSAGSDCASSAPPSRGVRSAHTWASRGERIPRLGGVEGVQDGLDRVNQRLLNVWVKRVTIRRQKVTERKKMCTTPLIWAVENRQAWLVARLLQEEGIEPDYYDEGNHTNALWMCLDPLSSEGTALKMLQLLLRSGDLTYTSDDESYTVLTQAESNKWPAVAAKLKAEMPNEDGFRPLHLAAMQGDYGRASALLKMGADPTTPVYSPSFPYRAYQGKTARDIAQRLGNTQMVHLLSGTGSQ